MCRVEQPLLEGGAQLVRLPFQRITRTDFVERAERVAQMTGGRKCLRARERHVGGGGDGQRILRDRRSRARGCGRRYRPVQSAGRGVQNQERAGHKPDRKDEREPGCAAATCRRRMSNAGARMPVGRRNRVRLTVCRLRVCRRKALQALQQRERLFRTDTPLDRTREQTPGVCGVAALKCRDAGLQQLLGFALTLRDRTTRPFDVRSGARVIAIEEQHAGPDADCEFVLTAEIMVEAGEKQVLDL